MRYLAVILALLAALCGAAGNSQIVFQGTVNKPDGTPFWGSNVKVGIRIATNNIDEIASDFLNNNDRTELLNISNGSYSMVLPFSASEIDALANLSNNGNYYLQVYMASSNVVNETVFQIKYRLTPNVQILAVPIALSARGIYMNLTNSVWRVGETAGNSTLTDSMMVGKKVGIGEKNPNAMLSVVAVTTPKEEPTTTMPDGSAAEENAIYINGDNLIHSAPSPNGVIRATKAWRARWQ